MLRYWFRALPLTIIYCFVGRLGLAQRSAVSAIAPRRVTARPVAPAVLLGIEIQSGSQPATATHPRTAPAARPFVSVPEPLYVFNSSVIVGGNVLSGINPRDIKELTIYKGPIDAPWRWRGLAARGIIDFHIPTKVKSKTFAQLGRWLKLTGPVSYLVNGLPVAEPNLRIAPAAIAEIQITRGTTTSGTVVNIRTAGLKPIPSEAPPGTIWIRGTAAR